MPDPDYGSRGALRPHEYPVSQVLTYAIEDERLAQAEYQSIIDKFGGTPPFQCIEPAEEMHVAALEPFFGPMGMSIPPNRAGHYLIPAASVQEALEIGILAESLNIAMHNHFLERSDLPTDLARVLANLRNASLCHIQAFRRHTGR